MAHDDRPPFSGRPSLSVNSGRARELRTLDSSDPRDPFSTAGGETSVHRSSAEDTCLACLVGRWYRAGNLSEKLSVAQSRLCVCLLREEHGRGDRIDLFGLRIKRCVLI